MRDSNVRRAGGASSASRLTLGEVHRLAVDWCPLAAREPRFLADVEGWGPAHEIGHALFEPRDRRSSPKYDSCALAYCECEREHCNVAEVAAMTVSAALLRACGRPDLIEREIKNTVDYDLLEPRHFAAARAAMRRKKLWPIPRTRSSLEAALRRRLGRPRGGALPPPPPPKYADPDLALLDEVMSGRL